MRLAWLLYPLKWLAALGLVGGLFAAADFVNAERQAERAREAAGNKVQSPRRAKGDTVSLDAECAERYGLKEEPAAAVQWSERTPVYGQVVPNPRATSEVRAPFAGTLRADAKVSWPVPGQSVRAGQPSPGSISGFPPQERLTIQDNLNSARLKKEGDQRVVRLQQERVDRLEKIAKSQIGPQQLVDDALVLLENAKTQLAVDAAAVELWQTALADIDAPGGRKSSAYSQPLLAPADGEIVDLLARPGASVEPGAVVAQVVDFRHPLVRLDIPPRTLLAGPPPPRHGPGQPAGPGRRVEPPGGDRPGPLGRGGARRPRPACGRGVAIRRLLVRDRPDRPGGGERGGRRVAAQPPGESLHQSAGRARPAVTVITSSICGVPRPVARPVDGRRERRLPRTDEEPGGPRRVPAGWPRRTRRGHLGGRVQRVRSPAQAPRRRGGRAGRAGHQRGTSGQVPRLLLRGLLVPLGAGAGDQLGHHRPGGGESIQGRPRGGSRTCPSPPGSLTPSPANTRPSRRPSASCSCSASPPGRRFSS